ncbi:MAG: DUF2231 domain-containing protein [Alicyclobacillus sp.]|nr:DUF2231 domain-containing protein [Alicyclobacillus sp.]
MVVHFTIAIPYLAALAGLAGLIFRRDPLLPRAFLSLLILGVLATIAAGIAGVISESYVRVSSDVGGMLHQHKNWGELTGVLLVVSTALQAYTYRVRAKRVNILAFLFCLGAVVTVTLAGFLGGDMVYHHGLGVHV